MPRKNAKAASSESDGKEFFAAIAQIEKEKGIPSGYMMEKITQALASAYKRDHEGAGDNIEVRADPEKGDVRMYIKKDVVETVDNPAAEISLEEAREKLPHAQLGDVVRIEVKTKNFGRIAAQTARQVIIQGIREAERGMVYDEFNSKEHEILTATVLRILPDTGDMIVRIGGGSDNFVMSSSNLPPYMANISFHIAVSPKILTGGQIIVQTSRIFSFLCPNRYGCVWCRPFSP